jgi:hypothetical protein
LIEPDVGIIPWTHFQNYEMLIRRGEEAAEMKVEEIRKMLPPSLRAGILNWPKTLAKKLRKMTMR